MYIIYKDYNQLSSRLKTKTEILQWFKDNRNADKKDVELIKNHTKKGYTVRLFGCYEYNATKV